MSQEKNQPELREVARIFCVMGETKIWDVLTMGDVPKTLKPYGMLRTQVKDYHCTEILEAIRNQQWFELSLDDWGLSLTLFDLEHYQKQHQLLIRQFGAAMKEAAKLYLSARLKDNFGKTFKVKRRGERLLPKKK